jgi:hypothetical protein
MGWIKLGQGKRVGRAVRVPLHFEPKGIKDGTHLNATLVFGGEAGNVTARSAQIDLAALLESTPSLNHSVMQMLEGRETSAKITARDLDGLGIVDPRSPAFSQIRKPIPLPQSLPTTLKLHFGLARSIMKLAFADDSTLQ